MHDMLHDIDINWADLPEKWKNGTFIVKPMQGWEPYSDVIFKENRNSIENFLVEQK